MLGVSDFNATCEPAGNANKTAQSASATIELFIQGQASE